MESLEGSLNKISLIVSHFVDYNQEWEIKVTCGTVVQAQNVQGNQFISSYARKLLVRFGKYDKKGCVQSIDANDVALENHSTC